MMPPMIAVTICGQATIAPAISMAQRSEPLVNLSFWQQTLQ